MAGLAQRLLGVPAVQVLVRVGSDEPLRFSSATTEAAAAQIDACDDLCRRVARAGRPVWLPDDAAEVVVGTATTYDGPGAFGGVPLLGATGALAGALCVADRAERTWTAAERGALHDLAQMFAAELDLPGVVYERESALEHLREMSDGLAAVIEASPLAIVAISREGQVELWSPAAERMFGWGQEEVLRRPIPIVPEEEREAVQRLRERALRGERLTGMDVRRVKKDGSGIDVSLSTAPLSTRDGEIRGSIAILEDITRRKRNEQELRTRTGFVRMLQEVAVAANEAVIVDQALRTALERIRAVTGWPVGHALLRGQNGRLYSTGVWVTDSVPVEALRDFEAGTGFTSGQGLPGSVLERGEPVWIADLAQEHDFPRRSLLLDTGLRAAFAFPIRVGDEVTGVLEFFSSKPAEPDLPLLEVMQHVGTQLGRVVERDRAVQALRRSEERFRFLFRQSPVPQWVLDVETLRFLDVNNAAVQSYGYSREEFLAIAADELREPGAPPRRVAGAAAPERPEERTPMRHRRKDGTIIEVELTAQTIEFAGRAARLVVALDVTERRKAEERLRFLEMAGRVLGGLFAYEDRLESLARLTVPALADLCVIDLLQDDGTVVRAKAVHADARKEELLRLPEPVAPDDRFSRVAAGEPVLAPAVSEALLTHLARGATPESVRRLGVTSLLSVPLEARGRRLGVLTLASAGSGRRYGQDDLSLAHEMAGRAALLLDNSRLYLEAQQATRAREEILAVVSHELRSPLQAVTVLVDTLLQWLPREAWQARERRQLESVLHMSRRMARLVQDLLDVTRIEGGLFSVRPDREAPDRIVDESLEILRPIAERAGVRLEVALPERVPPVLADRQRLIQVIDNLAGNAIRVTPGGGTVTIGAEVAAEGLVFRVSDTGPGIPAEHLPHLFKRFWRPERAGGLGAGLGLAIAGGIIEAHGGRIWVETGTGGSTFRFTVPTAAGDGEGTALREDFHHAVVLLPDRRPKEVDAAEHSRQETLREQAAAERHARFTEGLGHDGAGP